MGNKKNSQWHSYNLQKLVMCTSEDSAPAHVTFYWPVDILFEWLPSMECCVKKVHYLYSIKCLRSQLPKMHPTHVNLIFFRFLNKRHGIQQPSRTPILKETLIWVSTMNIHYKFYHNQNQTLTILRLWSQPVLSGCS